MRRPPAPIGHDCVNNGIVRFFVGHSILDDFAVAFGERFGHHPAITADLDVGGLA
jgi:hypothetical protein